HGIVFYAKNRIDFMDEIPKEHLYNNRTNHPYGAMFGLEAIGFYDLSDFDGDGNLSSSLPFPLFGVVSPGDIRYKDIDGNGFIDESDVKMLGNSYPNLGYSLGAEIVFKGFNFSFLFKGESGRSVDLRSFSQFLPFIDNGNAYNNAYDAWAYFPDKAIDNRDKALFPRLTTENNSNNQRTSSLWMRRASYLRLKNLGLGYDFATSLSKMNKNISELKLFIDASNVVTFSELLKSYHMDPETGYGYPNLSSYSVGIKLTF